MKRDRITMGVVMRSIDNVEATIRSIQHDLKSVVRGLQTSKQLVDRLDQQAFNERLGRHLPPASRKTIFEGFKIGRKPRKATTP